MTEREVLALRAAYQVAYQNGYRHGALDEESRQRLPEMLLRQEAETEAIATFPLPPAKVWRCTNCHSVLTEVITVVGLSESGERVVKLWHRNPDYDFCGPVEEVEE